MADESVKKAVPKKAARKTSARKTVAKKTTSKTSAEKTTTRRKAPTAIAATNASQKRSKVILIISGTICLLLFIISAVIGLSDQGVINVNEVVDNRLQNASEVERREINSVRSRNDNRNVTDGGLQPSADQTEPVVTPPPVATTSPATASSSSDTVATSTASTDLESLSAALAASSTPAETGTEAEAAAE